MRAAFVTLGAIVLVATAIVLRPARDRDVVPPAGAQHAAPAVPPAAPAAAVPAVLAADADEPRRADAVRETWLMPDGTCVAPLNGATDPKPLADAWPRGVPWSPIVSVERSPAGVDWYVHADGSKSTTEMKWRDDLGRLDAVTRLAQPTPVAPRGAAAPFVAPR